MQKGYVPMIHDGNHIGYLDIDSLTQFYNENKKLQELLNSLVAASTADKQKITKSSETNKQKIANPSAADKQKATSADDKEKITKQIDSLILNSGLPMAKDMFIFGQTLSSTTAVMDFDTRTNYTITPDFGYVYYGFQPSFNDLTPYIGIQLEFRYFDKNIPFNLIHPKKKLHYLSFTTGLTLTSLKKNGKRDDLFSSKSLLFGFGIRLSSATRITLGGILFNKEDVNPLIDHKRMAVTPFAGVSIDLKLKSILNDFYGLIPTKKP